MFTLLSLAFIVAFLLAVLAVPFCRPRLTGRVLTWLERTLLTNSAEVLFFRKGEEERFPFLWVRIWGAGAACIFCCFHFLFGGDLRNAVGGLAVTGISAMLAAITSALIVIACFGYWSYLGRAREYAALRRCGVQGLWIADAQTPAPKLREIATERIQQTTSVRILDVTGRALIGKGPGPDGALLYDALAAIPKVPVSLLLLHPEAGDRDPAYRELTVVQSTLSDMNITPQKFRRYLQATLDAVEDLNEHREDRAKIEIRFYGERPAFKAMIFDDSAFVCPWNPKEKKELFTLFRHGSEPAQPSFVDSFRNMFMRLWVMSLSLGPAAVVGPHENQTAQA